MVHAQWTCHGLMLTESMAMWPGSSVSDVYIEHPAAYYTNRKGMYFAEAERWLAPILSFVPTPLTTVAAEQVIARQQAMHCLLVQSALCA
jgi:hypothetical protein